MYEDNMYMIVKEDGKAEIVSEIMAEH